MTARAPRPPHQLRDQLPFRDGRRIDSRQVATCVPVRTWLASDRKQIVMNAVSRSPDNVLVVALILGKYRILNRRIATRKKVDVSRCGFPTEIPASVEGTQLSGGTAFGIKLLFLQPRTDCLVCFGIVHMRYGLAGGGACLLYTSPSPRD